MRNDDRAVIEKMIAYCRDIETLMTYSGPHVKDQKRAKERFGQKTKKTES